MKTQIKEPYILTAKTFFWSPGYNASSRRRNEERRIAEVDEFFTSLGFSKEGETYFKGDWEISFGYRESCHNVYKSTSFYFKGKKTNIVKFRNHFLK